MQWFGSTAGATFGALTGAGAGSIVLGGFFASAGGGFARFVRSMYCQAYCFGQKKKKRAQLHSLFMEKGGKLITEECPLTSETTVTTVRVSRGSCGDGGFGGRAAGRVSFTTTQIGKKCQYSCPSGATIEKSVKGGSAKCPASATNSYWVIGK